jgi:hypothetical protein
VKSDLIVLGVEYVVQIRPQHVLIPGTEITYKQRLDSFSSLDLDRLPLAAVREHRRLQGAVKYGGLKSRLDRCPGVYPGMFGNEATVTTGEGIGMAAIRLGDRVGTIATPIEKLARGRFRVESHYRESREPIADCFDASIPEIADVDDDADDDEIDLWWETNHNGLRDPEGTLTAIVHQAAFKYLWSEDLLEQINVEQREQRAASRAAMEQRRRELAERNAERIVDKAIEQITREAARPSDDEWKPMA